MKISKLLLGVAFLAGASAPALADPPSYVWNRVAVCDPSNPLNCSKPTSGGLIPLGPLPAGSNIIGKVGIDQTTPGVTNGVVAPITGTATNPTSTLTRPANTTAYATTQLIGSSTTAGSVVVPSFAIANAAGSAVIPRLRLSTNATTGWGTTLTVNLWSAAPTYTNGDGGTYAVATNGAKHLAQYSCTLTQYGDAASGECSVSVGNFAMVTLASGTSIFWDLQTTGSATPISGQTFTLIPELLN